MRAAIAAWRPDLIVRESMEFSSVLEAGEIPVVRVGIHLDSRTDSTGWLEEIAAGALGVEVERLRDGPLLTRSPGEEDGVHRYRTDVPRRRAAELVYVTFGSEAAGSPHYPRVYREAAEALDGLPVLMTVGDRGDPAELGPLPRSVRVERWVSQADADGARGGDGEPRRVGIDADGARGGRAAGLRAAVRRRAGQRPARRGARRRHRGRGSARRRRGAARRRGLRRAAARVADEIAAMPPIDDAVELLQRSAAGHAIR